MSCPLLGPVMMDIEGHALSSEDRELLAHPLVGGFILFTRNFSNKTQLNELINEIRNERRDILIAVDYEGGRVQRFRSEFTRIPAMRQFGALSDRDNEAGREAARSAGWLIGTELRECDIDLSFAPVLDMEGGVSEIIGDRAFHSDPDRIIELATAFMHGMQTAGMAATGKHFPGHGHVAPDSHVELPVDERVYADLLGLDMRPFRALIAAGLPSVMMAHIRFPAIDPNPASLSRRWIQDILRGELGFAGAVFCDDLSMGGAAAMGGYTERAMLALEAGCDMLPVCNYRAGVVELLDNLRWIPKEAADWRLRSLRGKAVQNPGKERWAAACTLMDNILNA